MCRLLTAALFAASILQLAAPAVAQDMPRRKSGLWEITLGGTDMQSRKGPAGMTMSQCVDQSRDDAFRQMGQQMERENKCSRTNVKQVPGRLSFDSACDFGTMKTSSQTVVTGDFNAGYKMDIQSRFEPPMAGKSEGHTVIEAKWVGACKTGQRPGDMTMPGGMTMNIYDMMDSKKK